ncbi:MAG: formate C-acetyltransferase/glycerol dehydratase family glycyl radical enzyme [Enterobacteriaceae bacterium]
MSTIDLTTLDLTTLDLTTLSPRIKAHKQALITIIQPPVCTERALHYTEAYQQHLDQPIPVRRALALQHHLQQRSLWIDNDELIIGNQASQLRAAPIFPEYSVNWIEEEIDHLAQRPGAGFNISEQNKAILHRICPWWRKQTVQDRCYARYTPEQRALLECGIIKAEGNMTSGDGHLAVNFPLLLAQGLGGIRAQAAQRRQQLQLSDWQDLQREQFLKAVDITLYAVSEQIERYAALARQMAQQETRDWRRKELLLIAENCQHIAHQPPQTFWQALQLCYFIQLLLQIESNGHSVSFGRMDQYLYPWYQRDVEQQNSLGREQAIELLQSCWLKLLEVNKIRSGSHSKASAGSPLYQNVTIGGQTLVDGEPYDAVNPLSFAILESCGRLRSTQPNLSVRYHSGLSDDFLAACVAVIRCGFGMPAFNNDHIVIPEFIRLGVTQEDAYDYAAIGCIETAVGGKWGYRCTGMSFINFARVLLASLEGGKDASSQRTFLPQQLALSKGNFADFKEVMNAWDQQIRYYTQKSIEIECVVDSVLEENVPDILCSALVDCCIERGKSIKEGGAKYDWVSGLQVGIANLGNSLAAVQELVFNQGIITQQQLASALDSDFAGPEGEQLRQRLLNAAPKYGNDQDQVDQLLVTAYQSYIDELSHYHNTRYGRGPVGGTYYAGTSSISANVPFGAATMATPDGRKARTPLAEGASPASGTDTLGPTAVFNSIGKLPTAAILGGVLLNQKLNPATLESESNRQKLMLLLRTFFEHYQGWHVQYNIVSRATLLAAKAQPEQYRDLVVRVAGYSAFFTALSPDAQDDIIARTEHELA